LLTIHVAETKPSKPTPSFSLHLCPPVCHLSAFPHRAIRHSSFVIRHSSFVIPASPSSTSELPSRSPVPSPALPKCPDLHSAQHPV